MEEMRYLASGVPHVDDHRTERGPEFHRTHFDAERWYVSFLVLSGEVATTESRFTSTTISNNDNLHRRGFSGSSCRMVH